MKTLKYANQISKVEKRIEVLQKKLKGAKTDFNDNNSGIAAVKFPLNDEKDSGDEWTPAERQSRSSDQSKRYSSSSNNSSNDDVDPRYYLISSWNLFSSVGMYRNYLIY